ncbi:cobalamin-dependent protein, partial [Paracoccaceae bacterium]|nr:cobalamin-dependent protein [Paracoccaceae bacterium]
MGKIVNEYKNNTENSVTLENFVARIFPKQTVENILLINPPDANSEMFDFATAKRGRYWNYPPYGLGLLAEQVRQRGFNVRILNLNDEILRSAREIDHIQDFDFDVIWQQAIKKAIKELEPDFIGITCMFSQTHSVLIQVSGFAKGLLPTVPQALGGVHVTNSLAESKTRAKFLSELSWVNLFFSHEADRAFPNFLEYVVGRLDDRYVGQVFLNDLKSVVHLKHPVPPQLEDLAQAPAHDLLRPNELSPNGKIGSFFCHKPQNTLFATVLSNRGCRAQCTFCSVRNFNGIGVRRRSVQSVIDELRLLKEDYGIGHIMWLDDDFLYDRRKSLELFNEMVKQDV